VNRIAVSFLWVELRQHAPRSKIGTSCISFSIPINYCQVSKLDKTTRIVLYSLQEKWRRRQEMGRFIGSIVGYVFLGLGVVGLVLPFLQGVLFIFIGLIVLGRHANWAIRMLDRLKNKHSKLATVVSTAENWVDWTEHKIVHYCKQFLRVVRRLQV
jgi:uncharacterized protein